VAERHHVRASQSAAAVRRCLAATETGVSNSPDRTLGIFRTREAGVLGASRGPETAPQGACFAQTNISSRVARACGRGQDAGDRRWRP
jgi:hypothetical protein